jgi:hypothetical protein
LIKTINGPIICVPYSNDVNDFNMFARSGLSTRDGVEMLRLCFNQLHTEGAASGRIMNFGLHPEWSKISSEALMLPPDDNNNSAGGRPVVHGIEQGRRGRCAYPAEIAGCCPSPDDCVRHGNARHIR